MSKISWGTKIAILYIGFVLLIGTMVTMSVYQKIDVVSDDYYQKELVFQKQIDQTKNADALVEKISHVFTDKTLAIKFPSVFNGKKISGEIVFFRPSDALKDFTTEIQLDVNSQQQIQLNKFIKGMYKMQVSWKVDNIAYYTEEVIVIP
ncbi:MAG: FixH family protein [Bacteroidetes bacterium]|nr:FixH family protein [Bacteroidota bacterium]